MFQNTIFPLLMSLTLVAISPAYADDDVTVKEEPIGEVVTDSTDFAISMYANEANISNNLLFSPYSIFTCMSMVYAGARDKTASEMAKALHLTLSQEDLPDAEAALAKSLKPKVQDTSTYQLHIANGLWLDKDTFVLSDFRHAIDTYDANFQSMDFSKTDDAINIINTWTANQTQDKIKDLLHKGDIDKMTRMVLTNAIYFKGNWVKAFDAKNTKKAQFWTTPKESKDVQMMEQTGNFDYFANDSVQVLSLPFIGRDDSRLACLFILPKAKDGIKQLQSSLSTKTLQDWMGSLDYKYANIKIPKFSMTQRFDLNNTLKDLGIKDAFTPQANFSGIDGMKDLFLSKVVHQAFFALDEIGVTAAAATAASINVTSTLQKEPPIPFIADHPFLFLIVDHTTQAILFLGQLSQPN